jgi:hypothetical protein
MDSWPTSREVEKVKPFAERATACIEKLNGLKDALILLGAAGSDGNWSRPMLTLQKAVDLLNEARTRGVKGKDLGK